MAGGHLKVRKSLAQLLPLLLSQNPFPRHQCLFALSSHSLIPSSTTVVRAGYHLLNPWLRDGRTDQAVRPARDARREGTGPTHADAVWRIGHGGESGGQGDGGARAWRRKGRRG